MNEKSYTPIILTIVTTLIAAIGTLWTTVFDIQDAHTKIQSQLSEIESIRHRVDDHEQRIRDLERLIYRKFPD